VAGERSCVSGTTDPVGRTALQIHHGENSYCVGVETVEQRVRKTAQKSTTDRTKYYRPGFWVFGHRLARTFDFREERSPRPGLSKS
jgi:hypothetical protein